MTAAGRRERDIVVVQHEEPLADLFRTAPREVVMFLRVLMGVGTITSIGMLLYSFPTFYWFDYAIKARRNSTNWVLYWWLGGVCAVQFAQIPLRLRMHWRIWIHEHRLPRDNVIRALLDLMGSLEWRLNNHIGTFAYGLFLAGSFLTSFARHITDEHDNELHTTVIVSLVALAARIAFSFCWFFFNFMYRNDMPGGVVKNARAATDQLIEQTVVFYEWRAPEALADDGSLGQPGCANRNGDNAAAAAATTTTASECSGSEESSCEEEGLPNLRQRCIHKGDSPYSCLRISTDCESSNPPSKRSKYKRIVEKASTISSRYAAESIAKASEQQEGLETTHILPLSAPTFGEYRWPTKDAAATTRSGHTESVASVAVTPASSRCAATVPAQLTCAVCLSEFENGDSVAQLPCSTSHVFHKHCIVPWLRVQKRCPLCTIDIDEPPTPGSEPAILAAMAAEREYATGMSPK